MKITDSHVHFWDPERLRYPWLDDLDVLKRPFLPADYAQATAETDIDGLVFVQADCLPEQGLAEVDWVAGLDAPVQAIVAFAPLELGEKARPFLEQLKERPLVKGARRLLQSEAVDFALRPDFVRGVKLLSDYDLNFDICVLHHQLPAVVELVRRCPDVRFVLDHLGKPGIAAGKSEKWQQDISALAGFNNVCCKLSGVITEAQWDTWTAQEIAPYLDFALHAFGIDRVMFGSDWPVVNLAGSFSAWMSLLQQAASGLDTAEQEKLFGANARTFYGVEENG